MYRTIEVAPIAGALGAEVTGVDLAGDLSDEMVAEIRAAWLEHLVLIFHGERLGPDAFMDFARRIGQPVEYPFVKGLEGYPEIIAIAKLPNETVNFGGIWHSDHRVPRAPADGHAAHRPRGAALRRRHDVGEHVHGVRGALTRDAAPARRPGGGEQQPRSPTCRRPARTGSPTVARRAPMRRRSTCRSTRWCARTRRPAGRRCT